MDEEIKAGWTLSGVVTFHCIWIIALFMGGYGWIEVAVLGESAVFAFLKHTYHVAVLSCALVVILTLVVHRQVTRPVLTLNAVLYRIGAGFTDLPKLKTSIRELKQIERGIERMRARMHLGEPGLNLEKAEKALSRLRVIAQNVQESHLDEAQSILDSVVELSEALPLIAEQGREIE